MDDIPDPIDKAIKYLHPRRTFKHGQAHLIVACLIRTKDWRPLKAPWWLGKEVCIIGADLDGNFFLCHCDGSVRYWNHATQTDEVIAASVRLFVAQLIEG